MFEKVFKIRVSELEKQQLKVKIERIKDKKVEDIHFPEKERIALTCPVCKSDDIESLGLQSMGKIELKGDLKIIAAGHEDQLLMAYYQCKNCNRVFYLVPEKVKEK